MRVPSIKEAENAEWPARGAPARQICFARTVEEKPTWMAARFPHSTLVFRPVYHRKPVPARIYHGDDRALSSRPRNSRLDANPLVEIFNSQTGGSAHAAVTFNPWYQKQIGIVDEGGNWSIWEISGRHRQNKGNWTAACVKSGTLPWLDTGDGHDIVGRPRHDGWGSIEWVGDFNSFIVSDRRCPMLYRMESDQVYPYFIELGLKKKSEWILDVKRSTCNVSHVFILTTSRVFWLDIKPDLILAIGDGTRPSLFPRLSWRHFRDPEDTTLQLTPLTIYQDCYLVLFSRLNYTALAFYCPTVSDGHGIRVPDPFIVDIPAVSEYNSEHQPSLTQFSSLIFREIMHLPSTVGKRDYDPSLKLIKLFVLDSRLSVRELIYVGPCHTGSSDEQDLGKDVIRLKRRYPVGYLEDFVVDDWDESVVGPGTLTTPDTGISSITPLAIPQWTVEYSQVYEVATGKLKIASEDNYMQAHEKSFQESLKELDIRIFAASENRSASQTLYEI
jgi:RNA polymerase I-specific transcription initiation factor RRN6